MLIGCAFAGILRTKHDSHWGECCPYGKREESMTSILSKKSNMPWVRLRLEFTGLLIRAIGNVSCTHKNKSYKALCLGILSC